MPSCASSAWSKPPAASRGPSTFGPTTRTTRDLRPAPFRGRPLIRCPVLLATRPGPLCRGLLAALALSALLAVPARLAPPASAASWSGGVDLYRAGAYTVQAEPWWCTAASIELLRNLTRGTNDHSSASQSRYFWAMRAHDRYPIPVTDGVDVAGWTWGLRTYVDARYQLVASATFEAALRSAVTNLRRTGLPVPITVRHGDHAWVIVGFTATADPARTSAFTVTSIRVVGLAYGLQDDGPLPLAQRDPPPGTLVSPARLASMLTAFHDPNLRMAWDGRFVTIQPIQQASSTATPKRSPAPASATARPTGATASTAHASAAHASAYHAPADLRMVLRGYPPHQGPWPI